MPTPLRASLLFFVMAVPNCVLGAPPAPYRVVIVVEENHSFAQVIGSPSAPYINSLATAGASLTNMFGITHPSQPNYIQFFSGTNQGVTSNNLPAGLPFSTPNLASSLLAAGKTLVSYSEDLPVAGSQVEANGFYFRKHNPVANWTNDPPGVNQVPSALNQPFTAFPTDFELLPTVSLVVPNQLHDMHDGTIEQADTWLQLNLGAYVQWCQTHNSLLIIVWDEDSSTSRNRIPTILVGPMVRTGDNGSRWTLHNLHRTIADMYGASPAAAASSVEPITGVFTSDPVPTNLSFQQGVNGYQGSQDTFIEQATPAATHENDAIMIVDGSPLSQGLVRFDSIVGTLPGQVPPNANVLSAKLSILTGLGASDLTANSMALHRMLVPWSEVDSWNSLISGVGVNGTEAATVPEFSALPNTLDTWCIYDVTNAARSWAAGASNHGWAIIPSGTDGWRFASSESVAAIDRPLLEIAIDSSCAAIITQQPATPSVCRGQTAVFSMVSTSTSTQAFRWRRNGVPLADDARVSGTATSSLTIAGLRPSDSGSYDCVVSTACNNIASDAASIVVCAANLDDGSVTGTCDAAVDINDLLYFLAEFEAGSNGVDLDDGTGSGSPDGGTDISDLLFFLARFEAGC